MASPLASSSRPGLSSKSSYSSPPVIRNGFIIPSIRLTPPDSRPHKSAACPEQDLSNETLYVPLRTEEIGWEEGGVIWGARRPVYAYPTVNLYGGDDDHVIGTYRGGPKGYSFFTISDPNFSAASTSDACEERELVPPPRKAHDEPRPRRETGDEIESDKGCSSSGRGRAERSTSTSTASSSAAALPKTPVPLAPLATEALPRAPLTDAVCVSSPTEIEVSDSSLASTSSATSSTTSSASASASISAAPSLPSSSSSSRRGSSSSDTDADSGADTGATTPASPTDGAAAEEKTMADLGAQLETRLSALSRDAAAEEHADAEARPSKTLKLAPRAGGGSLATDAACGGGKAADLPSAADKRLSASFELDAAAPGAKREWPAGRGNSRPTASAPTTTAFAGGSEYEANFGL